MRIREWMFVLVAASALAAQGPPAPQRVAVVYREEVPTEGTLDLLLGRWFPGDQLRVVRPGVDRLPGRTPVVVLAGATAAAAARKAWPTCPVVFVAMEPAPPPAGVASVVFAFVDAPAVLAGRRALIPGVKRLGVVASRPGVALRYADVADTVLEVVAGARSPDSILQSLGGVDAVLIPDDPELTAMAERLVASARARRLPVVTTSPWLARSGAAVGIVPDLESVAWSIARAVKRARVLGGAAPPPRPPSVRRTVDLGFWHAVGRSMPASRLALADEILRKLGR
ncbi:MAG: hypothetical protein CMJ83_20580 [Planctomycetes bacterium]|nr:hypothetical protein [Planctomycetota bacterium]